MRFRPYELMFKNTSDVDIVADKHITKNVYPKMRKVFKNKDGSNGFILNVESGVYYNKEIVCLLGQNGSGKTTFMRMLETSMKDLGVSYKPQNTGLFDDFNGTVQELLEKHINKALGDTYFRCTVLKLLKMDQISKLPVKSLSGGERQRLAITICLGTPATVYLIDEPSADLDCEQRLMVARVIKKWIINYLGKTCFLIEHDFMMSSMIVDRIIVYDGEPGIECTARAPVDIKKGFNSFLKQLNVTFRQNKSNYRLRINKKNSSKDNEQKKTGDYYIFD